MFEDFVMDGMSSSFSKHNVNLWAREAVADCSGNGTPLNEKIASIAEQHNLNNEQIQRVVEAANIAMDANVKGQDFETAKTAGVLAIIKRSPSEKACSCSDYMSAPEDKSQSDLNELFGVKPQESTSAPLVRKAIKIKIIKLASAKSEIEGKLINLDMQKRTAESDLVKVAKQHVMQNHEDINDLYNLSIRAGHEKLAQKYFPLIADTLAQQFVIEKTAFRADSEYISDDLNKQGIPDIRIINGNHGVLKSLQTIKKIDDDIVTANKALTICDDKIKKYNEEAKRIS